MKTQVYKNKEDFLAYYPSGKIRTGEAAVILNDDDDSTVLFSTNNFDGSLQTYGSNGGFYADDYKAFVEGTLTKWTVPNGVTEIAKYLCDGYSTLEEVIFPQDSKVTMINNYAFRNCGLTHVELPPSVATIGSAAFGNNPDLEIFTPKTVTTIYGAPSATQGAFNNVKAVYLEAEDPDEYLYMAYAFGLVQTEEGTVVYVPRGCKEKYKEKYPHTYAFLDYYGRLKEY